MPQHGLLKQLSDLSARLWAARDLEQGLREMLAATLEMLGADMGNIQLADADRSFLSIVAQQGFREDFLSFFDKVTLGDDSACARAFREGERVVLEDIETEPTFAPYLDIARAAGFRAVQSTPLLSAKGDVLGVISTHFAQPRRFQDEELYCLTLYARQAANFVERVQTDMQLQRNEFRFRALVEAAAYSIYRMSPDWTEMLELTGSGFLHHAKTSTRDWLETYILPEDRQFVSKAIRKAISSAGMFDLEHRVKRADGSVGWTHSRAVPIRTPGGEILEWFGAAIDITETKDILRRLDETQRRLQAVMEAAPVGISYSDDATCQRITGNKTLWKQFEVAPKENISATAPEANAVGRRIRFFSGDREVPHDELPLQRAVAERREIPSMELKVVLPSGRQWHTLASSAPVTAEDGAIIGGVAVTVDITERRRMEQDLLEADQRRNEFLAVLAHELRNPLAPLRNGLYVLRRQVEQPPSAKLVEMMEKQVDSLVRLVDDLMEVARIKRGKFELRKEITGLPEALRLAVATSAPAIEANGHDLSLSLADDALTVDGDPTRLAQVFSNLLNNAAKFTPSGGRIEVVAKRVREEAVVCVRDNGRGIAPDMLPRVFELFAQEVAPDRQRDGIGVGLALARSIVQLHGGRLEAVSEGRGRGSAFTVFLPLAAPVPAAGARKEAAEALPGKRVLVVDDNRAAADSLVLLLQALNEEAKAVYSGEEALVAISEFKPHLAFVDIGMPVLDGLETARRIKEQPNGDAVVLVALSGWGRDEDRRRSLEAGFHNHLVKPIGMTALRECLLSGVAASSGEGARGSVAGPEGRG